MGTHYLLNLYGCCFSLLDDKEFLVKLLEDAAICSGATVIQTIYKKFDPQGVTVLTLLSESHVSIHTWPETGEAAVDIFTCGTCNPKLGGDLIIEQLKPSRYKIELIRR